MGILYVVVQLALYRLAAFGGEQPLRFREIDEIISHLIGHIWIWLQSLGLHLGHGALDHVPELERQEWDEEIHQVLVDQGRVPQTTWNEGRSANGRCGSSTFRNLRQLIRTVFVVEDRHREVRFQVLEFNFFAISSGFPELQSRLNDALASSIASMKQKNGTT